MLSRRELLATLAVAPLLRAQERSPDKITTDVNVVSVFATVRDKKGDLLRDLTKDDFTVEEDSRPQEIKYFSKESDLPLTLGLVIDTSGSMRRVIDQEKMASHKFFDQVLREDKDQAFVIHFDSEVELLQDLTPSKKLLHNALQQLDVAPPRQLNRRDPNDPTQPRQRGGTSVYDAVLLACDEEMKKQTGRKAIMLFSDGEDNASRVTLTDAIASAQRADTLVYTILYSDEQGSPMGGFGGRGMGRRGGRMPMPHVDGRKVMERLAKETGGGFFDAKKLSLDQIYRQIQDELRSQYSLGYTPSKDAASGYRAIRVIMKEKGLVVQARAGYYADK